MQDNAAETESDDPGYIDSGWSFGSHGNGDHQDG
jgi:hypothetical protein